MSVVGAPVAPGTEIFGILYSDGSSGCWRLDRDAVVRAIGVVRTLGMTPRLLIRLRMKTETLWTTA